MHSVADSSDDSADDEVCKAESGALEAVSGHLRLGSPRWTHLDNGTNDHDDRSDPDDSATAKHVSEPKTGERTSQAANCGESKLQCMCCRSVYSPRHSLS